MDRTKRILLLLLLKRRRDKLEKKKLKRQYWVHPYLSIMNSDGNHFTRKYEALKTCDHKFYSYFRMSVSSFEELLTRVAPRIQKQFVFRKPVGPLEKLGLTIR